MVLINIPSTYSYGFLLWKAEERENEFKKWKPFLHDIWTLDPNPNCLQFKKQSRHHRYLGWLHEEWSLTVPCSEPTLGHCQPFPLLQQVPCTHGITNTQFPLWCSPVFQEKQSQASWLSKALHENGNCLSFPLSPADYAGCMSHWNHPTLDSCGRPSVFFPPNNSYIET